MTPSPPGSTITRIGTPSRTVAAAVTFALLLDPALAGADDEVVDSLEARTENLAAVVAGLGVPELQDAEVVSAQVVEPPDDPEAEPLPDDIPEGDDEQLIDLTEPGGSQTESTTPTSDGEAGTLARTVVGGLTLRTRPRRTDDGARRLTAGLRRRHAPIGSRASQPGQMEETP